MRTIFNRGLARLREELGAAPRRPRASAAPRGPRLADRQPAAWSAAVDAWLGVSGLHWRTCRNYRVHLAAAGSAMGRSPAELTPADLVAYRAALLEDGRAMGTHLCVLVAVRSFLLWAGERGLHAIDEESIRTALRGWHGGGRCPPAALDAAGEPAAATVARDHGGGV